MEILGPVVMILLVVSGIPLLCGLLIGYFLGKSKGRRLAAAEGPGPAFYGAEPYTQDPHGQDPRTQGLHGQEPHGPESYSQQWGDNRESTQGQGRVPDQQWGQEWTPQQRGAADRHDLTRHPMEPPSGAAPASYTPPTYASTGDVDVGSAPAGHPPAGYPPPGHPPAGYSPVGYPQRPELSAAEREAERKRRESRGINIALYIGGLLLTTAALLFTAAVGNPAVTASSLAGAFLAFAGGGLALALCSVVLRPAGVALFGTSLALLPILGVPLDDALIRNGFLTWFIISLVGLCVYGYGAVVLDSRVLGYLVIPFLYSSIVAATSVLQWALLWTLLGIIVLSALTQIAMLLGQGHVPKVLRVPFGTLHPLVVPAVLLAALLLVDDLHARDYAVLFGASAFYYAAVSALDGPVPRTLVHRLAARLLATAALVALLVEWHVSPDTAGLVLSVWTATMYVLVSWVPGISAGATRRYGDTLQGSKFLRGDRLAMLLVALVCGIGYQMPLLAQHVLDDRGHGFLAAQVLVSAGLLTIAAFSGAFSPALLRAALGVATVLSAINHPYYALGWALLWILGEFVVAAPPERARWQRAVGVAAGAAAGLTIGALADDPLLGDRMALSLTAIVSAGTAAALLLVLRAGSGRVAEVWAYLAVFIGTGLAGTEVFDIPIPLLPAYFAVVAGISYGLLAAAVRWGRSASRTSSVPRLSLFGAAACTGALLLLGLDPGRASEAWVILAVAAILLLVEWGAALLYRGAGPAARPSYRWGPLHVTANCTWLAAVNLLLVVAEAEADLFWFTAASWAVVYGIFAVQAADLRRRAVPEAHPAQQAGLTAAPTYGRTLYDRVLSGLYAVGVGLLALGSLLSASSPWWVYLTTGAAAIVVAALMLATTVSREESTLASPVYAALGAALVVIAGMDAFSAQTATTIYLASLGAFCAALGIAAAGLLVLRSLSQSMPMGASEAHHASPLTMRVSTARRRLLGSSCIIACATSFLPMVLVTAGESYALAWLVPAMHLVLLWPATRASRHSAALGGSVLIPLTSLWAWYQWEHAPGGAPGDVAVSAAAAGALLLVIVALLLSEALLAWLPTGRAATGGGLPETKRPGRTTSTSHKVAAPNVDWPMMHYGTASAVTVVVGGLGLQSQGTLEQLAPILAATILIVGGLARSRRLGIYFGAVVIVLAVLRWLSQWMFLFLIFLGVLIIGAAVWRLIVIQRRGTRPAPGVPAAARPDSERTDSEQPDSEQGSTGHTP